MLRGVSSEIPSIHSLHLLGKISGIIALVMKVGDGSYGEVDSTYWNASTEKSEAEEIPALCESSAIHTVIVVFPFQD